jgi:hypothetical protein
VTDPSFEPLSSNYLRNGENLTVLYPGVFDYYDKLATEIYVARSCTIISPAFEQDATNESIEFQQRELT